MISLDVVDTDAFLEMPATSQNLYFHLSARWDDDWFVASPNKVMKICNASRNDYDVLIAKQFIIPFDSWVCVIRHWKIHNYLRSDRYKETMYKEERAKLALDGDVYQLTTVGIPMVDVGKDRIGKVSEVKDSIGEEREGEILSNDNTPDGEYWYKEINQIIEIMKQACTDAWLQYMAGYRERQFAKHILSKKLATEIEKYSMPLEEFVANIIKLSAQPYMKPVNTPQLFYQNWGHIINASISQKKGSTTTFAYI